MDSSTEVAEVEHGGPREELGDALPKRRGGLIAGNWLKPQQSMNRVRSKAEEKRLRETNLDLLLERCKKGDHDSWRLLVERHQSLVYSIARRYRLSEEDSADVFQQTFQALHGSLDRLQAGAALPKWLAVTAAREALRIKRFSAGRRYRDLSKLMADG